MSLNHGGKFTDQPAFPGSWNIIVDTLTTVA